MKGIISSELFYRELLSKEINLYFDIFYDYFNSATNILKYMFINIDNYNDKNIKSLNIKDNGDNERFIKKHFDKIFIITKNKNIKKIYQIKDKFTYFNISFELYFELDDENPNVFMDYFDYKNKNKIN